MGRFGRKLKAVGVVLSGAALALVVNPTAGAGKVVNPGSFVLEPTGVFFTIRSLVFDLTPYPSPQCSDGLDNDLDGRTDAAQDQQCVAPAGGVPGDDDSELVPGFQLKENVSIAGQVDAQGIVTAPATSVKFPPSYIGLRNPF